MAITIKGLRLESLSIGREADSGLKVQSATYSLISSADTVLAEQTLGAYSKMKLEPSAATLKLLREFTQSYAQDVSHLIGLDAE